VRDFLVLYAAAVATFLAYLRWRDYQRKRQGKRKRQRKRQRDYQREPILEITPSPPIGDGAYALTLLVRNPNVHTLALESVRLTSPRGGCVSFLESDDSEQSLELPLPLDARPSSPEIDANSEKRFDLVVAVPGSPKLPLTLELVANLLLKARTRWPKRKTARLAAVIQSGRGA